MKKILFSLFSILLLSVSCSKEAENHEENKKSEETANVTGIIFKKLDLAGASALALAQPGYVLKSSAQTKADGENVYLLYKVDESSGTLVEVEYTIIVETEGGTVEDEMLTANMKLAMECIYTIGDKWLWLYNCSYYCENLEEIDNEILKKAVSEIINSFGSGHSFLVRRTDGALFPWDDVSNPSESFCSFNERRMFQYDVDSEVITVGEDIVTRIVDPSSGGYKLYCIYDNNDVLDVKQLLNDSVWSDGLLVPVPGEDAIVFRPTHVNELAVLFTKSAKMRLVSKDNLGEGINAGGSFVVYDNQLYVSAGGDPYFDFDDERLYSLRLGSSGEDVYLFENSYGTLTLKNTETIFLRSEMRYGVKQTNYTNYVLQATADDPMCFASSISKNGSGVGITLPEGRYELLYTREGYLYVDDMNNRTHDVGPVYFIHPLIVDAASQTASWGEQRMHFYGFNPCVAWNEEPGPRAMITNNIYCIVSFDLENRDYTFKTGKIPADFPQEVGLYVNTCAYVMNGTSSISIYSLETLQKEEVPIVMSQLPFDIVGNIEWNYNIQAKLFYGIGRTLEGDYITIYIPVTGENRGVARITVAEASGAGDNISQLIRLN